MSSTILDVSQFITMFVKGQIEHSNAGITLANQRDKNVKNNEKVKRFDDSQ